MSKIHDSVKGVLNLFPLMYLVIGVITLAFFISFIMLWGFATGVALFLFGAIFLVVLQVMGAINLWKAPWLVVFPPLLIIIGRAGQYFSILTVSPIPTQTPYGYSTQITLANSISFIIWIAFIAVVSALIIGYALKKRR